MTNVVLLTNRQPLPCIILSSKANCCISDSLLAMRPTPFLLRDSYPQQIQWSSELNSPIPVHLSSLIPKMLMFTLAISCLTTSSFPRFVYLTLNVPMQCCSLQHWTLLSAPDMSTTECHFCFGPDASFFLKLLVIALCSSPVAYQSPSKLGGPSSGVISFCSFILFMGFSWQEYWSELLFPSPKHLSNPRVEPTSPALAGGFFTTEPPGVVVS